MVSRCFRVQNYYEPKLQSDATQIGRFLTAIVEAGVEDTLKATINTPAPKRRSMSFESASMQLRRPG